MTADMIDSLLERYLGLLDEYTRLRATLADLQAGVYQDLARANFAAERGIRYGQDSYDNRARSQRTLVITTTPAESSDADDTTASATDPPVPTFTVLPLPVPVPVFDGDDDQPDDKGAVNPDNQQNIDKKDTNPAPTAEPLRWFGLLSPPALRQAQTRAIRAVEDVIPRLASVEAEMAAVEIRVRRARKKRAKAEAAAAAAAATAATATGGTAAATEVSG